jgi:hypothetical protein
MILAGICIVAAAILLILRRLDAAFVVAALGMVAWFLNYRAQLKQVVISNETQQDGKGDDLDEH